MTGYVHGYATPEQERLLEQAEHWRQRLICDGTELEPGTPLLEVGCGVGAVLAVLGQEYPGVQLWGVDIERRQLDVARVHLARSLVEATLVEADALALPFGAESFRLMTPSALTIERGRRLNRRPRRVRQGPPVTASRSPDRKG
jgi:cyclopropane fatty-acyl-phospholipid synthase-like methyltransferase